ncbi:hypothetical protein Pfo_022413 [Paulownia fortunei]|nr:hypothetical protein Pfo_022413 [Paulownia fortunei]
MSMAERVICRILGMHCAADMNRADIESSKKFIRPTGSFYPFMYKKSKVNIGGVRPTNLREMCEKELKFRILLHVLWCFSTIHWKGATGDSDFNLNIENSNIGNLTSRIGGFSGSLVCGEGKFSPMSFFPRSIML